MLQKAIFHPLQNYPHRPKILAFLEASDSFFDIFIHFLPKNKGVILLQKTLGVKP
jgi:hypothetical protein